MRTVFKVVSSIAAACVLAAAQASADILAWDVSGHGTPTDATLTATTIGANIANSPALSRVNVTGTGAGNAFNQNGWNNTATFLQNNNYVTFTLQVGASPITLDSLDYAINGSNTGPRNGRWGFSINGGSFTTFDFTVTSAQPAANTSINLGSVGAAASDSVEFRWWQFGVVSISGGTSAAGGTSRISNTPTAGNDLVLTYTIVPEPSTITLIGFGLVGLLALGRRRRA